MNIGCDIVKIDRFKCIKNGFIEKILSKEEIEIYNMKESNNRIQYLAGRFALKEAIIKTFCGKKTVLMNEISILNDENGALICKYKNYNIMGSIAHEKEYAIAYALLLEEI